MNVIFIVLINILERKTLWYICVPADKDKKGSVLNFNVIRLFGYL